MTFLDLHPIDPYEARYKVIATLYLLSQLGVLGDRVPRTRTGTSGRTRTQSLRRQVRTGTRLVRPPRSC